MPKSRRTLHAALAFLLAATACGNEHATSGETGGAGMDGAGGDTIEPPDVGPGEHDRCAAVVCDDGNDCTVDACDPRTGGCLHDALVTNACRPRIEVEFPSRGATIVGAGSDLGVEVSGRVGSGLGTIESVWVNGEPGEVDENGRFSQRIDVQVGGNTLLLETVDSRGNARSKVQSFLWSTAYRKPTTPKTGIAFDALGIWLSQAVLDDGQSAPPLDFAEVMNLVLQEQDFDALVDPDDPVASEAGYDIYVTTIEIDGSGVELEAVDDAIELRITLSGVRGDLRFDCTTFGCRLLGGDSGGSYSVRSVVVDTEVRLGVTLRRRISVTLRNTTTTIDGLEVRSDNRFTDFLLGIVERFIIDSLVGSLEGVLSEAVSRELGPLLRNGLSELALQLAVDLPNLFGGGSVPIDIVGDFQAIDVWGTGSRGSLFVERAGAYASGSVSEDDDDRLGVPLRNRCGRGRARVAPPRRSALEVAFSDDLVNQILYAAWRAGWLDVELGSEVLEGADLSNVGVTDLELRVRGLLAPTVSDCNVEGVLRAHLGDVRIDGELLLDGMPLTFTAFASFVAGVQVGMAGGRLGVGFRGVDGVEIEISIEQDALISLEALLRTVLEEALTEALEGALDTAGELFVIPLPEIDLSQAVGLPPGSAVIEITPERVERIDGFTVIGASL